MNQGDQGEHCSCGEQLVWNAQVEAGVVTQAQQE